MLDKYLSQERFTEITSKFSQSKIAVIGDYFLDEYLILDKNLSEISLETALEALQVVSTRKSPGVAGTVTNILRSLDIPVSAIGFSGDDGHGYELRKSLNNLGVNLDYFSIFPDRFTPTYTKPMLLENGRETEQSRLDTKNHLPLQPDHEKQLIQSLRKITPEVNAVLIIDQAKNKNCGVITDAIRAELAILAQKYPNTIFMADSRNYMSLFKNTIVKFNVIEASKMFGIKDPNPSPEFISQISLQLFEYYHKPIILTLGEAGLQVTDHFRSVRIPAIPVTGPIDIVGAGDSVLASAGAAMSVGASLIEASIIGNITASIIIQQIGTTGIATCSQLKKRFDETHELLNTGIQISDTQSIRAK